MGTAALLGFVTSLLVLKGNDLTRLMVTLGVSLILREVANSWAWLTGGADGLQGVAMAPILGMFEFDIFGRTAYIYCLSVLFLLFLIARRIVEFALRALAARHPGQSAARRGVGVPVVAPGCDLYDLGRLCGVAGALIAQTSQFVSLDVLDFHRSADVMLVLVIGGAGYLYGGIVGAVCSSSCRTVAALTPQYWMFWIGLILVVLVSRPRAMTERGNHMGRRQRADRAPAPALKRGEVMAAALETINLAKRFGGIDRDGRCDVCWRRRATCAHRAERRRQDHFRQHADRRASADGRPHFAQGEDITRLPREARAKRGMARTFQINQLFRAMTPLEIIALVVSERLGGGRALAFVGGNDRIIAETAEPLTRFGLADIMDERTSNLPYGKQRQIEIAAAFAAAKRTAARRAGGRRAGSGTP